MSMQGLTYRGAKVGAALAGSAVIAGCVGTPATNGQSSGTPPQYRGVETRLLDGDLVNFRVSMSDAKQENDVVAYAECAAAQYALIRGFGFARHVRTNVAYEAGIWRADAVYTISSALPEGLRTIDAEVVVANCQDNKIPTV